MSAFKYDHVHLRSPDPEETARYYEKMFGAEIIRSVQSDGRGRIDLNLGGLTVFIAKAIAELKKKGAEVTREPTTIRPGVRIAFIRGPQNVHIELLDRQAG